MALKYFRDLEAPTNETYIMQSLEHIGSYQTLTDKNGKLFKNREEILNPSIIS